MDFIKNSVKNIFRKKLRSILTIVGIGIGVLSVVIISLIGEVGKETLNAELNSMGIGGFCVRAVSDGDEKQFGEEELELVRADASVEGATPLITKVMKIEARQLLSQAVVWGIDENAADIVSLELLHGRLIRPSDVSTKANVCLVDESFAQLLYKRSNIVGKTVRIRLDDGTAEFTVVGVVASGGNILQGLMGDVVPTFLYVPFTSLSRLGDATSFSQIVAKLDPAADEDEAELSIVSTLSRRLNGAASIKVENLNRQKDKLNGIVDLVAGVLSVIGGISLLVAGLSIMTVMLVTVHERTREIGIKKSIGANRRTILLEFLTEAFLLSLIGSVAGAAAGLLLGTAGCWMLGMAISIDFRTVGFCILFSVGTGVLFGVYPAVQAARLKPVEALRGD